MVKSRSSILSLFFICFIYQYHVDIFFYIFKYTYKIYNSCFKVLVLWILSYFISRSVYVSVGFSPGYGLCFSASLTGGFDLTSDIFNFSF